MAQEKMAKKNAAKPKAERSKDTESATRIQSRATANVCREKSREPKAGIGHCIERSASGSTGETQISDRSIQSLAGCVVHMATLLSESTKALMLQNQMLHERLIEREKDAYDAKSRKMMDVEKARNTFAAPPKGNGSQLGLDPAERDMEIKRQIEELETNVIRTN